MAVQVLKVSDQGQLYDVLSRAVNGEAARALAVAEHVFTGTLWVPRKGDSEGRAEDVLSGSFATLRPMTGGSMTVVGTAAEIAPGTTGRRGLWLRNEEDAIRVRIDGSGITDQTGAPMEPGEGAILLFDPAVFVPVYVISEAGLARLDYNWW